MRVFISGGAGFIGSVLCPMLLREGYQVRAFDNLTYTGTGLLGCFHDPNFEFIKGDIRDEKTTASAMDGCDAAIHLAAIVGFPACRKDPEVTKAINVEGTKIVGRCAGDRPVLYGSTGSNYGAQESGIVTEKTPLNPLTLYGTTKTDAERYLLDHNGTIAFRFASGFGVSPRMRLDLLVNEFVYKILRERYLVVYEAHFLRSFCHVRDIARTYIWALSQCFGTYTSNVVAGVHTLNSDGTCSYHEVEPPFSGIIGQVYNVGDESLNCTKAELCKMIQKRIPYYLHFADTEKDPDQRNCKISYAKIKAAGFKCEVTLERGIDEMIAACQVLQGRDEYSNV